jgi:hypothetical protein
VERPAPPQATGALPLRAGAASKERLVREGALHPIKRPAMETIKCERAAGTSGPVSQDSPRQFWDHDSQAVAAEAAPSGAALPRSDCAVNPG